MDRRTFIAAGGASILGLRFVRLQDAKPTMNGEARKVLLFITLKEQP